MSQAQRALAPASSGAYAGISDILESFRRLPLCLTLGWYDFVVGYRRTMIGPFWQTLLMSIWVAGLSLLFGRIFQHNEASYPAYLAVGLALWNFISGTLSHGPKVFLKNAKTIYSVNVPLLTYPLRSLTEQLLKLAFQSIVFWALLPFSGIVPSLVTLLALPGFATVVLTALWLVPLLGILGARFRDLSFAISSVMRFLFFATPVFWYSTQLGERAYVAHFNPITHYLSVVRDPLLGVAPSLESWCVVSGFTAGGALITLFIYHRFRRRIVFWL